MGKAAGVKVEVVSIEELVPDDRNANKGTLRGAQLLDHSLGELGAGRSVLLDQKRKLIAGNKTSERARDLGYREVVLVHSDGKRLVAVVRDDLDLDSPDDSRARALAVADNRTSEVGLEWDPKEIAALQEQAPETLEAFFFPDEVAKIIARGEPESEPESAPETVVEDTWVEIKIRVSPETKADYDLLMAGLSGKDEASRFQALLDLARRGEDAD